MKSFAIALASILMISCMAAAQDMGRYELSAGYNYASADQGFSSRVNTNGWDGSATLNLKKWVGIEGDISGNYYSNDASAIVGGSTFGASGNINRYAFLFGPRLAYRKSKVVPFVHGLFGVDRESFSASVTDPLLGNISASGSDSAFATAMGGGINYSISKRVALRTQGDYLMTRHGADAGMPHQNNFRAIAGLVFTFGNTSDSMHAKNMGSTAAGQ